MMTTEWHLGSRCIDAMQSVMKIPIKIVKIFATAHSAFWSERKWSESESFFILWYHHCEWFFFSCGLILFHSKHWNWHIFRYTIHIRIHTNDYIFACCSTFCRSFHLFSLPLIDSFWHIAHNQKPQIQTLFKMHVCDHKRSILQMSNTHKYKRWHTHNNKKKQNFRARSQTKLTCSTQSENKTITTTTSKTHVQKSNETNFWLTSALI